MINLFLINLLISFGLFNTDEPDKNNMEWKAGVASVVITPEEPMWMGAYAARNLPARGTLHDIWAKALAIEDANGKQAVFITSDLVGITKPSADRIRDEIGASLGLSKAQIILNNSHTHTGPEIDALKYSWRVKDSDPVQLEKINQYVNQLEDKIITMVGDALQSMEPAQLYTGNGVSRFAVNRRNNSESTLNEVTQLAGPSDHSVPVIKVVDESGDLMAVAFGYACHPTVLNGYKWSGDYVGFAQIELEKAYPGVTALFLQGAGGDQNPLPRRTVALAKQYGKTLAASVEGVLNGEMRKVPSRLTMAYSEIDLPFEKPPNEEQLLEMAEEFSGYHELWALYMVDKLKKGESLITSYPYPVQFWQLGNQPIISLGGEPVIDYAIELKKIFGQDAFVFGYSNDPNMAYIPSVRVLREGGYEGELSQRAKGLPAKWSEDIEAIIIKEIVKLSEQPGAHPQD